MTSVCGLGRTRPPFVQPACSVSSTSLSRRDSLCFSQSHQRRSNLAVCAIGFEGWLLSVTVLIGGVRTLWPTWHNSSPSPLVTPSSSSAILCASLHTFAFPPGSVKCHCDEVPTSLTPVSRVVLIAIQLALRQRGSVFCAFLTQEKKFAHFYGVDRARS